jgi:MFS family permease
MRSGARTSGPERQGLPTGSVRVGLRENAGQFALLVLVNAFVGATAGSERSVLPLLARDELGLASATAALGFLIAFGLSKATANFLAGSAVSTMGRRRVLLLGWIAALPVPALLYWAASWHWIVLANLLLGLNQGLAWSATVIMKIDLAGPRRRGLAMGLNEFAGYLAVAVAALAGGYLASRAGNRAALALVTGIAALLGLSLTLLFVRDTREHARVEEASSPPMRAPVRTGRGGLRPLAWVNQAGLVNNLNDGLAWDSCPCSSRRTASGPPASVGWRGCIRWSGDSRSSARARSPIGWAGAL